MQAILRKIFDGLGLLGFAQHLYIAWMQFKAKAELYVFLPWLQGSSFVRRVWFAFFSVTFSSEMKQYVAGRVYYLRKNEGSSANASLLRRNIHRFEKGIMAEQRKPVFGLDYLMQTVDQFAASVKLKGACLLNDWAFDILEAYFRVVDQNAVVSRAEDRFRKIYYKKLDAEFNRLPFVKKQPDEGAAMHFTTLIETRKSVRSYIKGSVPPRKSIEEAVRLAALAPSSCNRQPFKFYVFEEEDVVESIARLAGGARSFAEGLPALAMLVGSTSVSPSPGDRHLMYIDGSLAAMNFMLALESMGISSCPINWPDNRKPEKALRKMVHLEPFERVVMLMAMGRAKDNSLVACSVRKEVEELVKFNPVKPSLKSN